MCKSDYSRWQFRSDKTTTERNARSRLSALRARPGLKRRQTLHIKMLCVCVCAWRVFSIIIIFARLISLNCCGIPEGNYGDQSRPYAPLASFKSKQKFPRRPTHARIHPLIWLQLEINAFHQSPCSFLIYFGRRWPKNCIAGKYL